MPVLQYAVDVIVYSYNLDLQIILQKQKNSLTVTLVSFIIFIITL